MSQHHHLTLAERNLTQGHGGADGALPLLGLENRRLHHEHGIEICPQGKEVALQANDSKENTGLVGGCGRTQTKEQQKQ